MLLLLSIVGAAGASVVFAVNPSPALGVRTKNAAGMVVAALISIVLWQLGVAAYWMVPGAWCAAFLLLWASQFEISPDDLIWVRAAASTGVVVLLAHFFQ
jgi:energy-converting hydrogenase Eha subunit G